MTEPDDIQAVAHSVAQRAQVVMGEIIREMYPHSGIARDMAGCLRPGAKHYCEPLHRRIEAAIYDQLLFARQTGQLDLQKEVVNGHN